jgi:hypothetical protein
MDLLLTFDSAGNFTFTILLDIRPGNGLVAVRSPYLAFKTELF